MKFQVKGDRVQILAWTPAGHDHDEGYHEVASIRLSKSKNSYMNDWSLDEVLANVQIKSHANNKK